MQLLHHQRVDVSLPQALPPEKVVQPALLSRAQRAHARLSWAERLARNTRASHEALPSITVFGIPGHFAAFLGLRVA